MPLFLVLDALSYVLCTHFLYFAWDETKHLLTESHLNLNQYLQVSWLQVTAVKTGLHNKRPQPEPHSNPK